MRDLLTNIIRGTSGQIKVVKITGSKKGTKIQGVDENKVLFLEVNLNEIVPEFEGEFGISNLDLLKGLLALPMYKSDDARITVKRKVWKESTTVEQIEFRDTSDIGCDFRCMSPERVPDQAEIANIPWDVEFTPSATKLTEFTQLGGLFGGGDLKEKLFGFKTDSKGNLIATFGDAHAATHRGSMVIEAGVKGAIKGDPLWSHADFTAIMRLASGQDAQIRISNRGVLGLELASPIGAFKYYLRAQSR